MGRRSNRICFRRSSGPGLEPVDDGGNGGGGMGGGNLGSEVAGVGYEGGVLQEFSEGGSDAVRGELARGE